MDYYKYIAIVLVYRNADDLIECIKSMHKMIGSVRIVVVNAFYDERSRMKIEQIARDEDCDFLNRDNKGYSYGNNQGIEHALAHYSFDYIIISNPDITVSKFNMPEKSFDIIAPRIITRDGRSQNPMIVKRNKLSERFIYTGLKNGKKLLLYIGIGITKITREITTRLLRRNQTIYPIFQPHGSFVLISRRVVEKLHPVYDENMFLFAEEGVLAMKAEKAGFQPYFCSDIIINHKEDGSMKLAGKPVNQELKKSNIYFYETYINSQPH